VNKIQALSSLASQILADKVCPELAASATQLVFADGNADADIVFIGEAPGKSEDEQGKPFVGAAGKFLNEMLASIDLKREDVYITNIVKYRPPENRDPLPEEKAAFMPYLIQQLNIIQPKLTIFLGRHAMSVFFPSLRITQVHGKALRSKGRVYMPLYHPAAALYNGSMRATLLEDFARIPAILNKLSSKSEHIIDSALTDTNIPQSTLF
jgi:uracil-DNA glycosylase family 4